MITVKSLAGELISLCKESPEQDYIQKYVKEKFRPFTRVSIEEYEREKMLIVNVYDILPHLEQYIDRKSLRTICKNPAAIHFIRNRIEEIEDWSAVSQNPAAIELLSEHIEKVDWKHLSENRNSLSLLLKYPERVYWERAVRWIPDAYGVVKDMNLDRLEIVKAFLHNPNCESFWITDYLPSYGVLFTEEEWCIIYSKQNLISLISPYRDTIEIVIALRGRFEVKTIENRFKESIVDDFIPYDIPETGMLNTIYKSRLRRLLFLNTPKAYELIRDHIHHYTDVSFDIPIILLTNPYIFCPPDF